MKTAQPAKLLMSILIAVGSLTMATSAMADRHQKGENDHEHEGAASTLRCVTSNITACGVNIAKSVCSSGVSAKTDDDRDHDSEGHDAGRDTDDGHGHHRKDDDKISPPSSGHALDFDYSDSHGSHHVDQSQRMGSSVDGKLTVCHRMGGARVTLDIPDDQINGFKAHGHGNHDMDTIGRCEDQDDGHGNDDYTKVSAAPKLSQKPQVTSAVTACLSAPAGTPVTVNGTPYTAPGCNASGVTCSITLGGSASGSSLPNSGAPNRGAVKTLR